MQAVVELQVPVMVESHRVQFEYFILRLRGPKQQLSLPNSSGRHQKAEDPEGGRSLI
jgi:hypothetical protein